MEVRYFGTKKCMFAPLLLHLFLHVLYHFTKNTQPVAMRYVLLSISTIHKPSMTA